MAKVRWSEVTEQIARVHGLARLQKKELMILKRKRRKMNLSDEEVTEQDAHVWPRRKLKKATREPIRFSTWCAARGAVLLLSPSASSAPLSGQFLPSILHACYYNVRASLFTSPAVPLSTCCFSNFFSSNTAIFLCWQEYCFFTGSCACLYNCNCSTYSLSGQAKK